MPTMQEFLDKMSDEEWCQGACDIVQAVKEWGDEFGLEELPGDTCDAFFDGMQSLVSGNLPEGIPDGMVDAMNEGISAVTTQVVMVMLYIFFSGVIIAKVMDWQQYRERFLGF